MEGLVSVAVFELFYTATLFSAFLNGANFLNVKIESPDYESLCLNPDDVARVAEFFDCDPAAAFEFVRSIWLPDARTTALRIMTEVRAQNWVSVAFLCDHLREGARSVGAERIGAYASRIERLIAQRAMPEIVAIARELRKALNLLGEILRDCM